MTWSNNEVSNNINNNIKNSKTFVNEELEKRLKDCCVGGTIQHVDTISYDDDSIVIYDLEAGADLKILQKLVGGNNID